MIHYLDTMSVRAARAKHPKAAIIRIAASGCIVFDNVADALGHPTAQLSKAVGIGAA